MSDSANVLEVRGLSVDLGRQRVLDSLDLSVGGQELLALMGPNGSGKTTLLRSIAGLERPAEGRILLDGRDITRVAPHRRQIGLLMQEPALFPRRTVLENVAYGPLVQRRSEPEARAEAMRALEQVRLLGFEDRSAAALSGGERQRVALARAIAARPRLILLDEPFAAIDPEIRGELRGDFRRILSGLGISAVHVTHDREEGLFLGDRVAVLVDGRVRAQGTPESILEAPRSVRVARFLGYNVVDPGGGAVAFFPRATFVTPPGEGEVEATLLASGFTGDAWAAVARTEADERVEIISAGRPSWPKDGSRVGLRWTSGRPLEEL